MRNALPILSLSLAALLFTGCASLSPSADTRTDVDHEKVYLVEKWARRNGVSVIWITTPMRTVPVAEQPTATQPAPAPSVTRS